MSLRHLSFLLILFCTKKKKKKEIMCNTRKTVLSATHTTAPRCVLMRDERRGRQRRKRRGEGGSRQQVAEEREILSAHLPSGASLTFLPHFNALHVPVTSQGILQDYCPRSTRKDIRAALRDCVSRTCVPDTSDRERKGFFFFFFTPVGIFALHKANASKGQFSSASFVLSRGGKEIN